MVGYFDFRVAGRLHLYFRSRQVMPQYFFALTLPIQLPPATIIHGAEARRTLPVKHGMRFLSLLPLMTFLRFLAGRQAPSSRASTSATNPALGTNSRMRARISSRRPSRSATCIVRE